MLWFGRLRWLAVLGLAGLSLFGSSFDLPDAWPSLLAVAGCVAVYNLAFRLSLARDTEHIYRSLRNCATRQMVLDLAALIVAMHFTGGVESPLTLFLLFHMAIGTIMISAPRMYAIAGLTSGAVIVLFVSHAQGWVLHHSAASVAESARHSWPHVASIVLGLFFIVYATATIVARFRQRGIELFRLSQELRARTEEQQVLLEQMRTVEERKAHYMRISAHQLRSPLATIKTSLQVLLEGYVAPESERGRKLLNGISERADSLLDTVNGLLELAKMREGRARAPWARDVLINQLLADIVDSLTAQAEERDITIETSLDDVATLAWGIPPDLVYCFENVVQNAIKYSRPGGRVSVTQRVADGFATVSVSDEGIGIPPELLDKVFLEFVRAPNAKHHAPEGSGLGLAIAREAVLEHGGDLRLDSAPGEGTTVTIVLPLRREPPEVQVSLQQGNQSGYAPDTSPSV